MHLVAIVALARTADEEAPALSADLGLTTYETAVMLRAPPPVIVFRTDDRSRAVDVLERIHRRRHEALTCSLDDVVTSDDMFRPKSFRFDGTELVGLGPGEERRIGVADTVAFVRATHMTQLVEDVAASPTATGARLARALTGTAAAHALMPKRETKRHADERDAVLYLFPTTGDPWLLRAGQMRYDGLGERMRVSRAENFEVLLQVLRDMAPTTPYDTRLLANRALASKVVVSTSHRVATSSAGTVDLLAHIVATALRGASRPYR